ncbi:MAG: EAL domain-containing protein [Spirochaetaceae bacterium]|nr:EAL domain-containing protein [Spirochaetaceae bacterium]
MDTGALYKKRTRHLVIPFVIAFAVVMAVVSCVYAGYLQRVNENFEKDNNSHVMELALQSARLVNERVARNHLALEQMASTLYKSENLFSDAVLSYLEGKTTSLGAIRVDLALPDGTAVASTSDHKIITGFNLGDREYFKRSLAGESCVQFLKESRVDGQEIFVCSVPVYQDKGVAGVLLGVYDIKSLEKLLVLDDSLNDSFSLLLAEDGNIIIGNNRAEFSTFENSFFTILANAEYAENYSRTELENSIFDRETTLSCMEINDTVYFTSLNPLDFGNCYLVTMFPAKTITKASEEFTELTILLAVLEMLLIASLGFFFVWVYRKNRQDLYDMAFKDSVTGGGNNIWFKYESESILKKADGSSYALIMLDIDNLKILNDTYGYEAGNRVLEYVYNYVSSILVSGELVARVMQDDFVLLLKYYTNDVLSERLQMLASKLNIYNTTVVGTDENYIISLSAGVYVIEDTSMDMLSIEDRAYMALHSAKKMQGSLVRCAFFQEQDRIRLLEEKRIENCMEEALANNEFVVYLQPKYNISTNTVSGAEALVRWVDPERGLIPPNKFIPLFERNGFIFNVDLFVFEKVCQMLRSELDRGYEPHRVSVNLSRSYLNKPNFLDEFKKICKKYDIPPKYIELELTETVIFENMELLIYIISEMHSFGFTCSLDDFGSGYSSLNMLKSVPVDVLKLDKEFFSEPDKVSDRGTSVIESVIELAQKLDMKTVSEGVEKEWQVELLRKAKCDMVQGFYYSKPVPIPEYEKLAFEEK